MDKKSCSRIQHSDSPRDESRMRNYHSFHPLSKALPTEPLSLKGFSGKRSYIIKFQLQVNFKDFLYQTVCVFSQMKDLKYITQDFPFQHLSHARGVGLEGTGGAQGVKNLFSSNMVISPKKTAF